VRSDRNSCASLLEFVSLESEGRSTTLNYAEGWAEITWFGESVVRVQAGPIGSAPAPLGYAVVDNPWPEVDIQIAKQADGWTISSPRLKVRLSKSPLAVEFTDRDGKTLSSGTPWWSEDYAGSIHESPEDERFFGFGLQFHKLDQTGSVRFIKTAADPPVDNGQAHAPDPFFYSTRGYGLFLNSHGYSIFDMKRSIDDAYTLSAPDNTLDYFFIYGPTFREISGKQTRLRGRTAMPPKWGLGFWYRMPSQWPSELTIEAAREFRDREIPCDVIGLEPKWQTHTYPCTYAWNKDYYSDPAGYVKRMRENGFHINLWEHAWVHPDSPIYPTLASEGLLADRTAMGGGVPDFTFERTRDIFADQHIEQHINLGVDGYKLDECDGSDFTGNWFYPDDTRFPSDMSGAKMHNLTGFLYNKAFHEMFDRLGLRSYLLLRANFAGGQRYASCIYSDYYRLEQYIRAQATSGFSGFLWCPELREAASDDEFLRRAQNMFFAPMAMINAWAGDEKLLPWNRNEMCEDVFRSYAQLRMRLLPYIYISFRATHKTGIPITRALVMDYPDDPETYQVDDQFMFGEALMIAPLAEGTRRRVYLPPGAWTDFWTDQRFEGGKRIDCEAPLDRIPIFVRSGSVVPMGPVMQYVAEKPVDEIELHIYPGEGSFTFYDDDGVTTHYLEGDFVEIPIEVAPGFVKVHRPEGEYRSTIGTFAVKIHGAASGVVRIPFGEEAIIKYSGGQ